MDSHFQVSPEMFDWVQIRALAGPLKDIHRFVPKTLQLCLGSVLRITLEGEPLTRSEVLSVLADYYVWGHFEVTFDISNLVELNGKHTAKHNAYCVPTFHTKVICGLFEFLSHISLWIILMALSHTCVKLSLTPGKLDVSHTF